MNTFQLECFLAVAENLSFARAAQQLHITQPAVTQQIKALEKELNAKLFARSTRSVKLTREGAVFLYDSRHILSIARRMTDRFAAAESSTMKFLSVGCYNYICLFLMIPVMESLKAQFPMLHPRLPVLPFNHIYRLLDDEELDAVVAFREDSSVRVRAAYQELTQTPLVCLCPPDSPLAQRESLSLKDLEQELLVLFNPTRAPYHIGRIHGELMTNRQPGEFYFCESEQAIMVLVAAGYGVSILPKILVPQNTRVVAIPLEDCAPLSFGIYYKSMENNPTLQEFIGGMRATFQKKRPLPPPADDYQEVGQ